MVRNDEGRLFVMLSPVLMLCVDVSECILYSIQLSTKLINC